MSDKEKIVRCDCGCTVVCFDYWKWEESSDDFYVEFYTMGNKKHWKWRLKLVLNVLLGRDHYLDSISISPEKAIEIRDYFNDICKDYAPN